MRRFKSAMMNSPIGLSCRGVEEMVDAFVENDLNWAKKLKIRFHLAMCKECDSYVRAYEAVQRLVRKTLRHGTDEGCSLPADITKKILSAPHSVGNDKKL